MSRDDLAVRRARHQIQRVQDYSWCACGVADCDAAVAFAALEAAEAATRLAEQTMTAYQDESAHLQRVIRHHWMPRAEQAEAAEAAQGIVAEHNDRPRLEARQQHAIRAFRQLLGLAARYLDAHGNGGRRTCPCTACLTYTDMETICVRALQRLAGPDDA